MNTLFQNQNKIRILFTGGNGDLVKYISENLDFSKYDIYTPSSNELDVSNIKSVENYFNNFQFDIVVNAAGTLYSSNIVDSDPELWIKDINVNLIGTYLVCRAALKQNSKTFIINVSSTAAYNSYLDWTSYCAAKGGVLKISGGLTKDGYNVITVCPGAIDTKFRFGLSINNPNVMSVSEGAEPIINAIHGVYTKGDVVFYRKNHLAILNHD